LVPLPGVAYPGVRDNRSTLNTKTGYDDDDWKKIGWIALCKGVILRSWFFLPVKLSDYLFCCQCLLA